MFWNKPAPIPQPPPVPPQPAVSPSPATPSPQPPEPARLGQGHLGVFDGPKNQLEVALMAFRRRELPAPRFLEELFNSEVYILPRAQDLLAAPVRDGKFELSKNPTLFCLHYPGYSALAMYTSRERARPTYELYPEFRLGAQVHAGDFLLGLRGDFGLVLNPYWDVNLEWDHQQLARILAVMKHE